MQGAQDAANGTPMGLSLLSEGQVTLESSKNDDSFCAWVYGALA